MLKYGLIGAMLLFLTGACNNPSKQLFEFSKESASVVISGTSTLHDWKMSLKVFDCNAKFSVEGSRVKGINDVTFRCRTEDLKSDNSLMDKTAYAALKSATFPEIKFNMISGMEISSDSNNFVSSIKGKLSIAGKSFPVSVPFEGSLSDNNGINIIEVRGGTGLKLSDFDITPPVAMMGIIKTGDNITVSFSIKFRQKEEQH